MDNEEADEAIRDFRDHLVIMCSRLDVEASPESISGVVDLDLAEYNQAIIARYINTKEASNDTSK